MLTLLTNKREDNTYIFALINLIIFVCFLIVIIKRKLRKFVCFKLKITITTFLIKSF